MVPEASARTMRLSVAKQILQSAVEKRSPFHAMGYQLPHLHLPKHGGDRGVGQFALCRTVKQTPFRFGTAMQSETRTL